MGFPRRDLFRWAPGFATRGLPNGATADITCGKKFCGNTHLLRHQRKGVRQWFTLETDDFAEAVTRAAEIRNSPIIKSENALLEDADEFIRYQGEQAAETALPQGLARCAASLFRYSIRRGGRADELRVRFPCPLSP
jgi:hypothetical protein